MCQIVCAHRGGALPVRPSRTPEHAECFTKASTQGSDLPVRPAQVAQPRLGPEAHQHTSHSLVGSRLLPGPPVVRRHHLDHPTAPPGLSVALVNRLSARAATRHIYAAIYGKSNGPTGGRASCRPPRKHRSTITARRPLRRHAHSSRNLPSRHTPNTNESERGNQVKVCVCAYTPLAHTNNARLQSVALPRAPFLPHRTHQAAADCSLKPAGRLASLTHSRLPLDTPMAPHHPQTTRCHTSRPHPAYAYRCVKTPFTHAPTWRHKATLASRASSPGVPVNCPPL